MMGVLPSDSGRVQYRFSKPGLKGTAEFSWVKRGALFRQDLNSSELSETVLGRGKDLFMLGPRTRTAQRAEVKPTDLWLNAAEMPYVTPGSGAGEVVGTGTVLGKPCEIRQLHSMRVWFWQGLPLRMERPASAHMRPLSLVATRLESDLAVSPDHFRIPAGFRVTEFPRKERSYPWASLTTAALIAMLLFIGVSAWVVERAFVPGREGETSVGSPQGN